MENATWPFGPVLIPEGVITIVAKKNIVRGSVETTRELKAFPFLGKLSVG